MFNLLKDILSVVYCVFSGRRGPTYGEILRAQRRQEQEEDARHLAEWRKKRHDEEIYRNRALEEERKAERERIANMTDSELQCRLAEKHYNDRLKKPTRRDP